MRAASDLHLKSSTALYVWEALADLHADAVAHGGPTILCGDILDQAKTVNVPLFNRLRDTLAKFPTPVYVIPGNHDQYDGYRNALEGLHQPHSDVHVISEPTVVPGVGLMVPYTPTHLWRSIVAAFTDWVQPGTPPIIWAHQGFKGAFVNSMRRDRDGLIAKDLPAKVIVTGHYHMPQNVGWVVYCGSPYQTTFAEEGQQKGFLFWEDVTKGVLPTRKPYPSVSAPKHYTLDWDSDGLIKPAGWKEGDKTRIRTRKTRAQVKLESKTLKKAGLSGAAVLAQPNHTEGERGCVQIEATPMEAVRQFINGVYSEDPNRPHPDEVIDYAREVSLWEC